MDKIILHKIRLRGIIGVYPWERSLPQSIVISVTLFTDTRRAAQTDELDDCIDYDNLAQKIRAHAETSARHTIEALADDLANICLAEKGVQRVSLRVEKPAAVAFAESAGVEIERP